MRLIRQILPVFLVLCLTAGGIPFICPHDVTRDGQVGLKDAIILVRSVAGTADEPGEFRVQVANAVTALHKVAELLTAISGEDFPSASIHSVSLGAYLPSGNSEAVAFPEWESVVLSVSSFSSITPVPIPHPPRS